MEYGFRMFLVRECIGNFMKCLFWWLCHRNTRLCVLYGPHWPKLERISLFSLFSLRNCLLELTVLLNSSVLLVTFPYNDYAKWLRLQLPIGSWTKSCKKMCKNPVHYVSLCCFILCVINASAVSEQWLIPVVAVFPYCYLQY